MIAPAGLPDFLEWDVRNWSVALEFWRARTRLDLGRCEALEIGSRHGGLSMWLALLGARVVCSDVGPPSERAVRKHADAGVTRLVRYQIIDGTSIPYSGRFDLVVFKSVLGAIGRAGGLAGQARAVREMHKALKPGGELFFAENLVASPVHRYFRRRFVRWSASWRYVSIGEMRSFLAPFRDVAYRTVGFAGAFGRTSGQRSLLGSLDRALLDGLVPERWRYVIAGVARK
jgi:SAM-dependent methyltransferase